jgi:hypothetical protein
VRPGNEGLSLRQERDGEREREREGEREREREITAYCAILHNSTAAASKDSRKRGPSHEAMFAVF